jgi:putative transposase
MSDYRRLYKRGGCYFFTLVTHGRAPLFADVQNVDRLKAALRCVVAERPFEVDAIVVLPDHLHCIWRLPESDADFSTRWRLIKHYVAIGISTARNSKDGKEVWQRRFWEHLIRDESDWQRHMDYIHFNPVKHGYVAAPGEWPHSSFLRCVGRGWYEPGWGRTEPTELENMELE